jgi:hypothetical protein
MADTAALAADPHVIRHTTRANRLAMGTDRRSTAPEFLKIASRTGPDL